MKHQNATALADLMNSIEDTMDVEIAEPTLEDAEIAADAARELAKAARLKTLQDLYRKRFKK